MEQKEKVLAVLLNHNKPAVGEGAARWCRRVGKKRKGYLAGLSGALSDGAICSDVWEIGQTTKGKVSPARTKTGGRALHNAQPARSCLCATLKVLLLSSEVLQMLVPRGTPERVEVYRRSLRRRGMAVHCKAALQRWWQRWNSAASYVHCSGVNDALQKLVWINWNGSQWLLQFIGNVSPSYLSRSVFPKFYLFIFIFLLLEQYST